MLKSDSLTALLLAVAVRFLFIVNFFFGETLKYHSS